MLDTFEIITTSGVVLWSRTYAPISPSIVNNFIADTFIEEKSGVVGDSQSAATNPAYKSDQHTLKWTLVKELGVIFVVWPVPLPPSSAHARTNEMPGSRATANITYSRT